MEGMELSGKDWTPNIKSSAMKLALPGLSDSLNSPRESPNAGLDFANDKVRHIDCELYGRDEKVGDGWRGCWKNKKAKVGRKCGV
jgi:hypothetical protein